MTPTKKNDHAKNTQAAHSIKKAVLAHNAPTEWDIAIELAEHGPMSLDETERFFPEESLKKRVLHLQDLASHYHLFEVDTHKNLLRPHRDLCVATLIATPADKRPIPTAIRVEHSLGAQCWHIAPPVDSHAAALTHAESINDEDKTSAKTAQAHHKKRHRHHHDDHKKNAKHDNPRHVTHDLPFVADDTFPFFEGDRVLGLMGKAKRQRENLSVNLIFEPLYLVKRTPKNMGVMYYPPLVSDDSAFVGLGQQRHKMPTIQLFIGRRAWTMPLDINAALQSTFAMLAKPTLIMVQCMPLRGHLHSPYAVAISVSTAKDPESAHAIAAHQIPEAFSPETLHQCEHMPSATKDGRTDLTHIPFVTIDGEDAKDFDDAVYACPLLISPDKTKSTSKAAQKAYGQAYRLMVAIADVSFYVAPDSPLDRDAKERSTSVYFPRRVVPMLPPRLSEDLCSLRPHVDRAVMVCEMVVLENGQIEDYKFYPAMMHSAARLTYHQVEEILFPEELASLEKTSDKKSTITKKSKAPPLAKALSKEVLESLHHLKSVYKNLRQARVLRGALELDGREWKFTFDELGQVVGIYQAENREANKLIEECMVAANVCAAKFLEAQHQMLLFRVHEPPLPEKIDTLKHYLAGLGIAWHAPETMDSLAMSSLLTTLKKHPSSDILQFAVLRSLKQAQYTPINNGHFGLGLTHYAHFTSPIRRYPDLLVHRGIRLALMNQKHPSLSRSSVASSKKPKPDKRVDTLINQVQQNTWIALGEHCTQNEKRADEASRDAAMILRCELAKKQVGQEVQGMITAVTSFGLFVQLEESYADGLLHIATLGEALRDYFELDTEKNRLIGQKTHRSFALSEKITVRVDKVEPFQRKVDLSLSANSLAARKKAK